MHVDVDLSPVTALIIDESGYGRSLVRVVLNSIGIRNVIETGDGLSALEVLGNQRVHLVVADYHLPPMKGTAFARMVRDGACAAGRDVTIVMVSDDTAREVVAEARNAGVNEFLAKPVSAESLYRRVRGALTSPKPFVSSPTYVGPDRRNLLRSPPGEEERRKAAPLPRPRPVIGADGPDGAGNRNGDDGAGARDGDADASIRRRYGAGEVIFNEGDRGDVAYVVETGRVSIFKTVDAIKVELGQIRPEGIFGELALIDNEPRMAAAQAVEDTSCLIVPMAALKAQLEKTPDLVVLVLETLLHDIRKMGRELGQVRAALEKRRAAQALSRPGRSDPTTG